MDASTVGRYGTLHLLKRLDPSSAVASYPIDEEEITIGRDPSCSIRLYYESVSMLHCKIIFRERKAFVAVLGTNGLLIDGCAVFPASPPSVNPVTVPLTNNSTIEIHKKSFQFCYPPKELRPILLATPSNPTNDKHRRRTLRMSMIQSAQVFTPGPSADPRENLRILQTPMKAPFLRHEPREPSPLKRGSAPDPEDMDDDEEIVLVESNHPKVLEEEKDLVILEHVETEVPSEEPQRMVQYPIPQPAQPSPQAPRTPRRRLHPRSSLHRAVLIRSAHRTALKIEKEAEEEEQDVEEVEETIQPVEMEDVDEVDEEEEEQPKTSTSGWRKSLEVVAGGLSWAFRASSVSRDAEEAEGYEVANEEHYEQEAVGEEMEDEDDDFPPEDEPERHEQHIEHDHDNDTYDEHEAAEGDPSQPYPEDPQTSRAPQLGNFMTPQVPRTTKEHVRYSVGGFTAGGIRGDVAVSGPRRVKLVEPWKVNEIVVPVKEELKEEEGGNPFLSPAKRERISEEERNAIRERRRSALNTPDNFAPGVGLFSRRGSVSPTKAPPPLPALNLGGAIKEEDESSSSSVGEDTSAMLARMKEKVDSVKRRQSMGPRPSLGMGLSPRKPGQFSLFAPDADLTSPRKTSNPFVLEETTEEHMHLDQAGDEKSTTEADVQMDDVETNRSSIPQASSSHRTHEVPLPATPKFTGMREMFKEAAQEMQTPRMDGMRDLFRPERALSTPAFEGVGEMLATPVDTRPTVPEPSTSVTEDEQMIEEEEPTAPVLAPVTSRTVKPPSKASGSKLPPVGRRTTPRSGPHAAEETPQGGLSSVPEDDLALAEPTQPKRLDPASRVTRKPRAQSVDPVPSTSRTTRTRVGTKTKTDDELDKPTTRRPRAESAEPTVNVAPKSAPARRGKKVAESVAPEEPRSVPVPKVTRRPPSRTAKTPTPTAKLEEKEKTKPATTAKRRGTRAEPMDVDGDDDELDGIPRDEKDKEAGKDAGAKVRRSARGKVKEEETDDTPALAAVSEEPEGAGTSRTTTAIRTRKTPANTSKTTTAVPASRSVTRGRAAVGASSAKKVEEPGKTPQAGDKENTPEPSTEEDPSDGPTPVAGSAKGAAAAAAKPKVTRSAAKGRATPTAEVESKGTEALKTRVSRAKPAAKK